MRCWWGGGCRLTAGQAAAYQRTGGRAAAAKLAPNGKPSRHIYSSNHSKKRSARSSLLLEIKNLHLVHVSASMSFKNPVWQLLHVTVDIFHGFWVPLKNFSILSCHLKSSGLVLEIFSISWLFTSLHIISGAPSNHFNFTSLFFTVYFLTSRILT